MCTHKLWQTIPLALLTVSTCTLFAPFPAVQAAAPVSQETAAPHSTPREMGNPLVHGMMENGVKAYKAGNYERALSFFREAASKNDMKSYRYLGLCYEHGCGVKKDIKQAFAYYQKAAELGDVTGTALLGHMYEDGLGTKINYAKAMELYQKAAVRDDFVGGPGKVGIGRLYEYGRGVGQNAAEARLWYQKALDSGYTNARTYLDHLNTAAKNLK